MLEPESVCMQWCACNTVEGFLFFFWFGFVLYSVMPPLLLELHTKPYEKSHLCFIYVFNF